MCSTLQCCNSFLYNKNSTLEKPVLLCIEYFAGNICSFVEQVVQCNISITKPAECHTYLDKGLNIKESSTVWLFELQDSVNHMKALVHPFLLALMESRQARQELNYSVFIVLFHFSSTIQGY